jgi:hypothetical protein
VRGRTSGDPLALVHERRRESDLARDSFLKPVSTLHQQVSAPDPVGMPSMSLTKTAALGGRPDIRPWHREARGFTATQIAISEVMADGAPRKPSEIACMSRAEHPRQPTPRRAARPAQRVDRPATQLADRAPGIRLNLDRDGSGHQRHVSRAGFRRAGRSQPSGADSTLIRCPDNAHTTSRSWFRRWFTTRRCSASFGHPPACGYAWPHFGHNRINKALSPPARYYLAQPCDSCGLFFAKN